MLAEAGVSAVGVVMRRDEAPDDPGTLIDAALQEALFRALPEQGCRTARAVVPWTLPVKPDAVLTRVQALLASHIDLPRDLIETAALWCLHAWCVRTPSRPFDLSPRLILQGEDARADHARALRVLAWLTPAPLVVSRTIASHVLPMIAAEQPTLLLDDVTGGMLYRRDMRTLIAAGALRDGIFLGASTRRNPTGRAPCFAPTAIATMTPLPGDVSLRSIVLKLAAPTRAAPQRPTLGEPPDDVLVLRAQMQAAALVAVQRLPQVRIEAPRAFPQAAREKWHPLIALGEAVGARTGAQVAQTAQSTAIAEATTAVSLLQDLRLLYSASDEHISTAQMLEDLVEFGRADRTIDAVELARRLRCFGLKPAPVRMGDTILRGYRNNDLHRAFARYLIEEDPVTSYSEVAAA